MNRRQRQQLSTAMRQRHVVRHYLDLRERPPGKVDLETHRRRVSRLRERIQDSEDPCQRLQLIQRRLDAEAELAQAEQAAEQAAAHPERLQQAEQEFCEVAADYSDRKQISWAAWREVGVPARLLREAGLTR